MRTRCLNPNSSQWPRYGGRGIKIAGRWEDFAAFLADMGPRPAGTTLDRWPDVNGHYQPGNCRWATMLEQENNKRNNVRLTHDGRTQTVAEWSRETGIGYQTIRKRMEAGWSAVDTLTVKPSPGGVTATRRSAPPPQRTPPQR